MTDSLLSVWKLLGLDTLTKSVVHSRIKTHIGLVERLIENGSASKNKSNIKFIEESIKHKIIVEDVLTS